MNQPQVTLSATSVLYESKIVNGQNGDGTGKVTGDDAGVAVYVFECGMECGIDDVSEDITDAGGDSMCVSIIYIDAANAPPCPYLCFRCVV